MLIVEELAAGIMQITNQGVWDDAAWQQTRTHVVSRLQNGDKPPYFLVNLMGTTELDETAFTNLVTAPEFAQGALSILVARRVHLKLTREILTEHPERDVVQLRLMSNLEDAICVILDKQALERFNDTVTS